MKDNRYTFTLSILTLFGFSTLCLSAFLIGSFYQKSLDQAYQLLNNNNLEVTRSVAREIEHAFSSTQHQLSVLSQIKQDKEGLASPEDYLRVMWAQLKGNNSLASIFVADEQGRFLQARRQPELVLRSLVGEKDLWRFVSPDGNPIRQESRPANYDPRTRSWYQHVTPENPAFLSAPYLFASTGAMGVTFALGDFDQQGKLRKVAAADYTLSTLSSLLTEKSTQFESTFLIVNHQNRLLAHSDNWEELSISGSNKTDVSMVNQPLPDSLTQQADWQHGAGEWSAADGQNYLFFSEELPGINGNPWHIVSFIEKERIVADIKASLVDTILLSILVIGLFYGVIHYLILKFIIRPIRELKRLTYKVTAQDFDAIKPVNTVIYEFDQLSVSMNQMVSSIQEHELQQKALIDSFIKILAGAIDAKSPYTGAHCERLPEVAIKLAQAAHDSDKGSLGEFSFDTPEQWREFQVAAWLHDCGKVVTPEYVVDKATKLETIHNRIHEIRTRFEILHRDATIDFLQKCAEQPDQQEKFHQALLAKHQHLQEDFAFLAECNVGGEFMDDGKIERIQAIAQTTWIRHFDDRLGLSQVEEHRIKKLGLPAQSLPVTEHLLSDKLEHCIERDKAVDEQKYQALGSKMPVPDLSMNAGEIYNLSIRKGTLTNEERFTINEHILETIRMLGQIPFTDDLKRVPEYAAGHHERMDGKGYPRQLTRDQLSIPARIIAISDVFEALTASDRPYKKAKTLSESLKIMYFMKKEGHLDPELFDLFLKTNIYQDYAKRFLRPEQHDEVDIEPWLDKPEEALSPA